MQGTYLDEDGMTDLSFFYNKLTLLRQVQAVHNPRDQTQLLPEPLAERHQAEDTDSFNDRSVERRRPFDVHGRHSQ